MALASLRGLLDSPAVWALRQQMNTLEDRLTKEINHWQQHAERVREATFNRLEEKIQTKDTQLPRLDRRVAELSGSCSGLSDELQSQLRRLDSVEERLWEWKHQMEESIQEKVSAMEARVSKVSSNCRVLTASVDDLQKSHNSRLKRLEEENERMMLEWEARYATWELETQAATCRELFGAVAAGEAPPQAEVLIEMLSTRVGDLSEKVDECRREVVDSRSTLESQEERMKVMRTRQDALEENRRRWSKIDHIDFISQSISTLQAAYAEEIQGKVESLQAMEMLSRRCDSLEQQLACQSSDTAGSFAIVEPEKTEPTIPRNKIVELEEQMGELLNDMAMLRTETALGPRINDLVEQLTFVVPKVLDHERILQSLQSSEEGTKKEAGNEDATNAMLQQVATILPKLVEQEQAMTELRHSLEPSGAHEQIDALQQQLQRMASALSMEASARQDLEGSLQTLSATLQDERVNEEEARHRLQGELQDRLERMEEDLRVSKPVAAELQQMIEEIRQSLQQAVIENRASETMRQVERQEMAAARHELLAGLQATKPTVTQLQQTVEELRTAGLPQAGGSVPEAAYGGSSEVAELQRAMVEVQQAVTQLLARERSAETGGRLAAEESGEPSGQERSVPLETASSFPSTSEKAVEGQDASTVFLRVDELSEKLHDQGRVLEEFKLSLAMLQDTSGELHHQSKAMEGLKLEVLTLQDSHEAGHAGVDHHDDVEVPSVSTRLEELSQQLHDQRRLQDELHLKVSALQDSVVEHGGQGLGEHVFSYNVSERSEASQDKGRTAEARDIALTSAGHDVEALAVSAKLQELSQQLHDQGRLQDALNLKVSTLQASVTSSAGLGEERLSVGYGVDKLAEQLQDQSTSIEALKLEMSSLKDFVSDRGQRREASVVSFGDLTLTVPTIQDAGGTHHDVTYREASPTTFRVDELSAQLQQQGRFLEELRLNMTILHDSVAAHLGQRQADPMVSPRVDEVSDRLHHHSRAIEEIQLKLSTLQASVAASTGHAQDTSAHSLHEDELSQLQSQRKLLEDLTRTVSTLQDSLTQLAGQRQEAPVVNLKVDGLSEQLHDHGRSLEELKLEVSTLQDSVTVNLAPHQDTGLSSRVDELSRQLHDQSRSHEELKRKVSTLHDSVGARTGQHEEAAVLGTRVDEVSEQLHDQSRRFEEMKLKVSMLQDSSIDEPHAKTLIAAQIQITRVSLQAGIDDLQRQLQALEDATRLTLAQPASDRVQEQQVLLRADVDEVQQQLHAMLPSLGRQDKDFIDLRETVAAAMRDMQDEVQADLREVRRLFQSTTETMTTANELSARHEEEVLNGIQVLASRVEGRLAALPRTLEAHVDHPFSPELADQLEVLVNRMEKNEAHCFALQENIRCSIKDLTDTVPFTVESLARLVSLLNSALSPDVIAYRT